MHSILKALLPFLLINLILTACGEKEKLEDKSLADEQIEKYSKRLEDCKEKAQEKIEIAKKSEEKVVVSEPIKHIRSHSIEPDDMVFGDVNAPVVFVEYFAPTCPACAYYHKNTFPKFKESYIDTGKVVYVMREFIGNKQDLNATILARCYGDAQNYEKFINVMLEQQNSWAFNKNFREILTNIAGLGGISPEKYAACLNDESLTEILIENTKLVAKEPRFLGTPGFFINGKQFTSPYTIEALSEAIEKELKAQELKADELKANELKTDDLKAQELKANELKADELKAQELKADELKAKESKANELKADES